MEYEHPGQVEAALNIFANSGEICGVAVGMLFLLGAISILLLKKWAIAAKLAGAGLSMILGGIALVWFVNLLVFVLFHELHVATADAEPWLIGLGYGGFALVVAFGLISFFFPTIVAARKSKQNRKLILLLNILIGAIPLGWNVVLFMAFNDDKSKVNMGS